MIKDVSIEIIQKCPNNCIHCSSCSTKNSSMMLPLDIIKHLIRGLSKLEVERICLSGGEPFLHPNLLEIVKQISEHHIIVDIYTCGVIFNADKSSSLPLETLTYMKQAGLRTLLFNFPSVHESTYDLITQSKGHFPLLLESIKNCVSAGIRAEIHFVPMKQNISDAVDVLEFGEKNGISQVNFLKLVPHGRARNNMLAITPDDNEINALRNRLLNLEPHGEAIRLGLPLSESGSTPPCHAVREKLYIKFDGSVFGCEAFKYISFHDSNGLEIIPDNIFINEITEIYNNSVFLKQSAMLVQKYDHCAVGCENCPVQKYLKEVGG